MYVKAWNSTTQFNVVCSNSSVDEDEAESEYERLTNAQESNQQRKWNHIPIHWRRIFLNAHIRWQTVAVSVAVTVTVTDEL